MYLQNKKGIYKNRFEADLMQYYLLHDRLVLLVPLPECVFGNPNILRNARLKSVASYGVFYENGDSVDMAYYPACNLKPFSKTGRTLKRILRYKDENFSKIICEGGYNESQGEENLKDFGNSLVKMLIGTPFQYGEKATQYMFDYLIGKSELFREGYYTENNINNNEIEPKSVNFAPITILIDVDKINGQII